MTRQAVLLTLLLCCSFAAIAQSAASAGDARTLDVTLAYSAGRTNGVVGGCGCFWMSGAKAEANANFGRGLSVVAEAGGEHAANIHSANESLSFVTYLFGPRYSVRTHSRFVPFVQFLVGGVHGFDALFPTQNQSTTVPDALAFAGGGGLNINFSRHVAMRAFQADYMQTQLPNGGNDRQNHLRLAAGIVLRLGRSGR